MDNAAIRRAGDGLRMQTLVSLAAVAIALTTYGCGRCDGALRGLTLVSFAGAPESCTERPECAQVIPPDQDFSQRVDTGVRESSPKSHEALLASAGVHVGTWFLVDESSARVEATIEAKVFTSAHGCANAASFVLKPTEDLKPGAYRLVMLQDEVTWPRVGDSPTSTFEGKNAILQYYRVQQRTR
jgi:hypothetical protein